MDGKTAQEGFGVIQLGEVTGYGTWEFGEDGDVTVRLDTKSLSAVWLRSLEHYKNSSHPIALQFPGDKEARSGVVLGFQRDGNSTVFFLRRRKPDASA